MFSPLLYAPYWVPGWPHDYKTPEINPDGIGIRALYMHYQYQPERHRSPSLFQGGLP